MTNDYERYLADELAREQDRCIALRNDIHIQQTIINELNTIISQFKAGRIKPVMFQSSNPHFDRTKNSSD